MSGRRHLAETLSEIAGGALDAQRNVAPLLRISSLELELPIELRIAIEPEGPVLVGDVPLMRMRSAFDTPLTRLSLRLETRAGAPT